MAVLAVLGVLVVAGTGGAVASNVLTGADIKNNSLTGKDVKDHSLTDQDINVGTLGDLEGQPGAAGASGAPGPSGPSGAPGPQGPGAVALVGQASAPPVSDTNLATVGPFTYAFHCHDGPGGNGVSQLRITPAAGTTFGVQGLVVISNTGGSSSMITQDVNEKGRTTQYTISADGVSNSRAAWASGLLVSWPGGVHQVSVVLRNVPAGVVGRQNVPAQCSVVGQVVPSG